MRARLHHALAEFTRVEGCCIVESRRWDRAVARVDDEVVQFHCNPHELRDAAKILRKLKLERLLKRKKRTYQFNDVRD